MLDFVLNFLFPPVCAICGKIDDNWLCGNCKNRIEKYEKYKLIVGKDNIFNYFNTKKNEIQKIYFDEILYCFEYKNIIRKLLLKYKFSDASYLSYFFANQILNNKKINEILKNYDIIIPVPMDKIKKAKRGYNQTELITNIINKKINYNKKRFFKNNIFKYTGNNNINKSNENINVDTNIKDDIKENIKNNTKENILIKDCIVKIKNTKTQSTLNSKERALNVKNAFKTINIDILKNKKVVLFDDICTTGATVNEISRILKLAEVDKILVLVIAKD